MTHLRSASASETVDRAGARRRPGGRTERIRLQVIEAVLLELVESGYDALTVDAVAARAGVHRTTVYRRWRDVGGLLADVVDAATGTDWEPESTGSLRGDLTALNRQIEAALTGEPPVTAALIAASFRSGKASRALQRFWDDRYTRFEVLVRRAAERGEIPAATHARHVLVAATAPLYHHFVLLRMPPEPGLADRAAAAAAVAAVAGAFTDAPQNLP
ncbi:TetR/AcrR family transcriptional regulator [Streptomyces sp. NPDC020983]|uniref:TetR/AcrR family transcriptional regulator n=1 Tax=Streptomyces sp. NPDC020983 TaxID=3365106 RepID=UPI00378C15B6